MLDVRIIDGRPAINLLARQTGFEQIVERVGNRGAIVVCVGGRVESRADRGIHGQHIVIARRYERPTVRRPVHHLVRWPCAGTVAKPVIAEHLPWLFELVFPVGLLGLGRQRYGEQVARELERARVGLWGQLPEFEGHL